MLIIAVLRTSSGGCFIRIDGVFFSQIGDFYSKFVSYKTLCMQLGQIKPCTTFKKGVSCKEELSPYHNYTCISLTIVICLSGPLMLVYRY